MALQTKIATKLTALALLGAGLVAAAGGAGYAAIASLDAALDEVTKHTEILALTADVDAMTRRAAGRLPRGPGARLTGRPAGGRPAGDGR